MSRRAVIFDLDGLVLDTEALSRIVWQNEARVIGYTLSDAQFHALIGHRISDCEAMLVAFFGSDFPLAEFRQRCLGAWRETVRTRGIPVKPGVETLLDLLTTRRAPYAIGTSSERWYAESNLESAGLRRRFEFITCGCEVARGKPAPDIYLAAAASLDVAPVDCIVFEDSEPGLRAAHAAGMKPIMVPDLKPPSDAARAIAECVLSSLDDARDLVSDWIR